MKRLPLHLLTLASLLLCALLAVLWIRSVAADPAWRGTQVLQIFYTRVPRPDHTYAYYFQAESYSGTVRVEFYRSHFGPAYFGALSDRHLAYFRSQYPLRFRVQRLGTDEIAERNGSPPGFRARRYVDTRTPGHRGDRWVLAVPHWVYLIPLALPPALHLNRLRKRRRRRSVGLCPACGYDLRATPDRCPECGAMPTRSQPTR